MEGVSVLGGWIAEGGDEERAAEHAWVSCAWRVWMKLGM